MKKVIFGLAVVAAAAFGVYNANKDNAKAQMSDLQSENVEALASPEPVITVGTVCNESYWWTCFLGIWNTPEFMIVDGYRVY